MTALSANRSGWVYPSEIQAQLLGFRISGSLDFLNQAALIADDVINGTDFAKSIIDALGNSEHQYSTNAYSINGEMIPNEVSFGTYSSALGELILLQIENGIDFDQLHLQQMINSADGAINLLVPMNRQRSRAEWDGRYDLFRSKTYKTKFLPLNMQSHIAAGLLMTYKVLEAVGDSRFHKYKDAYHRVALYISSKMYRGDRLKWKYWNDTRWDDWGHSGATVRFIGLDCKYGSVFSQDDNIRLFKILDNAGIGGMAHPFRVDGTQFTPTSQKYYQRYFSAWKHWVFCSVISGSQITSIMNNAVISSGDDDLIQLINGYQS